MPHLDQRAGSSPFLISTIGIALSLHLPGPSVAPRSRLRTKIGTARSEDPPGTRRKQMAFNKFARRRFVVGTAAASAALIAAPFVRSAHAAGKLSVGLWDHWVPNANSATETLIKEWAEKEKVEVAIDFITGQGNKLLLTTAAEAQAKSGHDILAMITFLPSLYADQLVPVNDLMEPLIKENGAVNATVEYLGKIDGKWLAVPATVGSQIKGPCSRIDYLKDLAGIDIQAMYPAGAPPKADGWNLDTFLKAAEDCNKGGHPFGIGLGTTSDSVDK